MNIPFLNIPFDLDDRVTAAAVTAVGTIIGALVQLRLAWRREVSDRARGVPVTKKNRRGPVLAVFLLLIAAALGGFAISQYLIDRSQQEAAEVRGEMQTQLAQISATAARLEQATLNDRARAARGEAGPGEATATTTVGPCRVRAVTGSDGAPPCFEQEALRVTLCESVPSTAVVTATLLYARPEGSTLPWTDFRAEPGQEVGRTRFGDKPFERAESDQTRQVCTGFSTWDGERAYVVRLLVKYSVGPAADTSATARGAPPATSAATVAPLSDSGH